MGLKEVVSRWARVLDSLGSKLGERASYRSVLLIKARETGSESRNGRRSIRYYRAIRERGGGG